jgi:NADH dehydrogenase/NADH:ubiquinone oxidoreductase subunit G
VTPTSPAIGRRHVRGLAVVLGLAIASMVALSGPSAEAAANPGRATATTSSETESGKAGSTENSDKHAKAKHNKQSHKAKQHKKSSGKSADKKSEQQSKKDTRAATTAKQEAQDEAAAQAKATAAQDAATSQAASYSNARGLAVAKATAAKKAAAKKAAAKKAAAKSAAAKKAEQVAAQNPIVATTVSTVSEPSSFVPFVPALISIPQANGTNKSAKAVTPPTKARQTPQHSKVAAEPPGPRRLAQAVGLGDGLQTLLVTAFVLVFGFGLVVGGTTRRVASRTR